MIDLELCYLLVLISSDRDEFRFGKREGVENVPSHAEDVVCLHHVDTRLVLVHRIENYLQKESSYAGFDRATSNLAALFISDSELLEAHRHGHGFEFTRELG